MDKNGRVYWGAAPLRGRVWPRAYGRSAERLSYEASLTPQSRGYVVLNPPPFLSSISFRSRTRCRDASAILWSCSWIRSVKPSDVFLCCADHVSMFCRRNCVRLQRGRVMSFGSSAECEPLEPFIQPLQAGRTRRGAIGGQGRSVVSARICGPVVRTAMPQYVAAAARTKRRTFGMY